MRVVVDKIASSVCHLNVQKPVVVGSEIPPAAGTVVAARVLDEKSVYNELEDASGRMMTVHRGDVIVGVLGERRALRGYSGAIPSVVKPGDILHLLNKGGVIGACSSANPEVGPAARVEILGSVLQFQQLGRRVGVPASINPGPIAPAARLRKLPPTIMVAGSCMHAGKTRAASVLIRGAVERGYRVGAAKLTGVALRRDALEMEDHGASVVYTFADAGAPSTCGIDAVPVARGCLNALAVSALDLLVVELGDGLMGEYGVESILHDPEISEAVDLVVLAATDPVAAWGGCSLLERLGYQSPIVTGPSTDNEVGRTAIRDRIHVEAYNACSQPDAFSEAVLHRLQIQSKGIVSAGAAK